MTRIFMRSMPALAALLALAVVSAAADEKKGKGKKEKEEAQEEQDLSIDLGKFTLTRPEDWEPREPRSKIVTYEFATPAAEGDDTAGRVTIMSAGGSVEENIKRWIGQFTQPDGESTEDRAKIEELTIAGQVVHLVDISGTYLDSPGPAAPSVERENYRMLAAIIVTKQGNVFVKFYGPRQTVSDQEEAFRTMVESLQRA